MTSNSQASNSGIPTRRGLAAAEKASAYEILDLLDVPIIRATCTSSTDFEQIVSKENDSPEAKTAAT